LEYLRFISPEGATDDTLGMFSKIHVKEYLYRPRTSPRGADT
jgi:hypothetical protein